MKLSELKCINNNVNLDNYIEFRELVKKNMPHPEWLGDFTKEDLKEMVKNGTIIWVYYKYTDPVCSMMLIPAREKDIVKFGLELDYTKVADYGPMFVNPKYVGNGLQHQMLLDLDEYAKSIGYEYAAATVHPDNIYCINNILKDNFELRDLKEFKRGPRNIYSKKI